MIGNIRADLDRFYELLARLSVVPEQGRLLKELNARVLPLRGVYFFQEPGEYRNLQPDALRVVRVGTHAVSVASKSTLRGRLNAHRGPRHGGGNHRGSVFRLEVGASLLARDGHELPTWGIGSVAPKAVREKPEVAAAEAAHEQRVSAFIGAMPVLWIDVSDEPCRDSARAYVERNAIALLSNRLEPVDRSSDKWLGRYSPRSEIRDSALWNKRHVLDSYDPRFLEQLELFIDHTCQQSGARQPARIE